MKWLITGGCGFIGTQLIARIRDRAEIRVLDNLSVGTEADLATVGAYRRVEAPDTFEAGTVQLVVGDIRDPDAVARAAVGADVVVHLAANTGVIPSLEDPIADCQANVLGIVTVLEGARAAGVKNFVFASSGAPLGEQEPPVHEDKLPKPVSPYGASKLAGEAYCNVYGTTFGLATAVLRFGNVYGPGSIHKGSVVAKWIKQALGGETLVVYGDGSQTRDFIYIDDLLDAVERAAALDKGAEIFQIATGAETTINEIAEALRDEFSARDRAFALEYTEARAGEVLRNYSDVSKSKRVLGWEAQFDVRRGIAATVDWFIREEQA